jgi:dimethylargininase
MTHPVFTRAIVRPPAANFADGLTTAGLGLPDVGLALAQHALYCQVLRECGLELTVLEADALYPDSTFVEDTAILTPSGAILTNPGAPSRKGEVEAIAPVIRRFFELTAAISDPGTLDGGDICEAGSHFFIGVSKRTNPAGARQLADWLAQGGYSACLIPVPGVQGLLHLKSGIAYLGDHTLVLVDALVGRPEFAGYRVVRVDPEENYAANCLRINDYVLLPERFPRLRRSLEDLGYAVRTLEVSEFEKMDGGLSCLSLRF